MRWVFFYHSLVSDWNHGNAHFLRGIVSELMARGEEVEIYEPRDGWSRQNLAEHYGAEALEGYREAYPQLQSSLYSLENLELDRILDRADVVLAHEWSEPELIQKLGRHRRRHPGYRLLFHDTHHRSMTNPDAMAKYDLRHFDGVLAYGQVIRDLYLKRGWHRQVWTWHEAADTRVFRPNPKADREGDLVWIGNWGDGERTEELQEFLLDPIQQLGLKAQVYGVRYPDEGLAALSDAGADYGGWLPNHRVPEVFSRFGLTVHVPRRPYREQLHGVPTIRVFEALACGIPLITAPWEDSEGLFRPGRDYLVARDGNEVRQMMRQVLHEPQLADDLTRSGLETISGRHTCRHRVDELLEILQQLEGGDVSEPTAGSHSGRGRRRASSVPSGAST